MSINYGSIDIETPLATAQKILAPKVSGRPRGGKNLFRNAKAAEVCAELGVDPLRELLRIAKRRKTPLDLKIQAYAHCLKFIHPALTTAHVTARTETFITTAKTMTLALERRPELAGALEALALEMSLSGDTTIDVFPIPPSAEEER